MPKGILPPWAQLFKKFISLFESTIAEPVLRTSIHAYTLGPTYYVDSYTSEDVSKDDVIRQVERLSITEEPLTPTSLYMTVRDIHDRVPNSMNSQVIEDFHSYMEENGSSERHQNNNLKIVIAFAEFLGPNTTFYQLSTKDHVTKFLDTKIKPDSDDPDKRWI